MKLNKSKLFLFMPHVSFEFFLTWFLLTFVDALDSDCLTFPEVFPGIYQPSASARSCAFECLCLRYGCDPEGFEMRGEDAMCFGSLNL